MSSTTVTSRGSEQSPKASRIPPTSHPFTSPSNGRSRRTPSVSPLSQASKTYKDSAADEDAQAGSPTPATITMKNENEDEDDSLTANNVESRDRSSSLSDIEGSLADQDMDGSESESPSTPGADDEEPESEAETERAEPTPLKGGNPAKMSMGAHLQALVEDPASDTDSVKAADEWDMSRPPPGLAGRKRKRTLISQDAVAMVRTDDSDSDSGESKRRGARKSAAMSAGGQIERELLAETEEQADEIDRVATPDLSPSKTSRGKGKGRGQKKQLTRGQETTETEPEEPEEQEPEVEEETTAPEDLAPEEAVPRTESKGNASSLRQAFSAMRSQILGDRIKEADQELEQMSYPAPENLEYLAKLQAITDRRDTKIRQEMKLLQYKKEALRISTLGTRSQLLSQYFQEAREIREAKLYELGELFYNIQKERRLAQSEELDQYTTKFPARKADQVKHQAKYNTEVSVLSGIAKYVGFPAAPEIVSARPQELEDDMRAMRIARRHPQPTYHPPRPQASSAAPDRAQKDFLEQTPWANPHHPVHAQSRTPSAFGHHGLSGQPTPSYGLLNRPTSTFATPAGYAPGGEQHPPGSNETIGAHEDPPSGPYAAPPPGSRIQFSYEQGGDISPTSNVKRAPPARRDFSGLSSASTIDMPQEGPMDARPVHQPYLTSAYHGQA